MSKAPDVLHALLDAAWEQGDGIGTGITLYRPVLTPSGARWAVRCGGDAIGFRISAPQDGDGGWEMLEWRGQMTQGEFKP